MKIYWISILSIGLGSVSFAQTPALYNNGAALRIAPGTKVNIQGNFLIQAGSNLDNRGTIATTGNVTNNEPMTQPNAGELILQGTAPQIIAGSPVQATGITVSNAAGVTLSTPVKVSSSLAFIAGKITNTEAGNALTFGPNATVSNAFPASDASHVNGFVAKEGNGSFLFPVGDGTAYQPVGVNLTNNTLGLLARYQAGDAGDGTFGTTGSSKVPLVARNNQEYWTLTPLGAATGSVSVYWDDYNNSGISDVADLAVAHLMNGSWLNEGANNAIGTLSNGLVTSNNLSAWSPFTLGSKEPSSPLPVRLTHFSARWNEGAVALDWRVTDAKGFSHFEVERSIDAIRYDRIGQVDFNGQSAFQFSDYNPLAPSWLAGNRYYRLKLVDTDGSYAYSKVQSVKTGNVENSLTAYPNPSRDVLNLRFNTARQDQIEATVISMEGKLQIKKSLAITQGTAALDTSKLAPGVYLLSMHVDGKERLLKFVKQ